MGDLPAVPEGDDLDRLRDVAHALERKIVKNVQRVSEAWWELAEQLYEFHEQGLWSVLGYETLNEFLAQPEVGLSRRQFFRMTALWRDLAVVRQVDLKELKEIEPSKAQEVAPAIMRGRVSVEDGLADARALGARDLREKYRPDGADQRRAKKLSSSTPSDGDTDGQRAASLPAPDPSTIDPDDIPLDASSEPERVQCPVCESWVERDRLPIDGEVEE